MSNSLDEIRNFLSIHERLGTGGQPKESQFKLIREAGFDAVINLALPSSDNALPAEGSIVTGLGMSYFHIPVNFEAPTVNDFHAFCGVMDVLNDRKIFVHCAVNKRVSAFVFLYRVLRQGMEQVAAERDLRGIWEPDAVWSRFIAKQLGG